MGNGSALEDASDAPDGRSSTDDDCARLLVLPDAVELLLFWRLSLRCEAPRAILGIMVCRWVEVDDPLTRARASEGSV